MKIVVPSYNRAGKVLTLNWLPDAIVVCCESQEKEYKRHYSQVVAIPDDREGTPAKKRNAVLDYIDDDIFLVDDDVRGIKRIKGGFLTPGESLQFIEQGFVLMQDIGAGYWGMSNTSDPMKINEFAPFSLTKFFWQAVGIKKDSVRYDERVLLGEDFDFFLQKILLYRKVFRFNCYYVVEGMTHGGISINWAQRKEREREDTSLIMRKWGTDIVTYKARADGYDIPQLTLPIKGV